MYRDNPRKRQSYFYRVEICWNLFGEYSVMREWGMVGGTARQMIQLFPDLRSASHTADDVRNTTLGRGYVRA
jgi:predicted DNA-binding WGR domain protein